MGIRKHLQERENIGFFGARQVKYESPFTFAFEAFCGIVLAATGVGVLYGNVVSAREHGERPELNWYVFGTVLIVLGVFAAHAGIIYWSRRLRIRMKSGKPQDTKHTRS